jgi:hypothetical protein
VPSVFDVYHGGQKVLSRTSHALGVLSPGMPKDLRFWGIFGVSVEDALKAWGMMKEHDLLPTTPHSIFVISCGHFPLCAHTLPTMQLSQGCWGGKT